MVTMVNGYCVFDGETPDLRRIASAGCDDCAQALSEIVELSWGFYDFPI
jgi:hypothetical protein